MTLSMSLARTFAAIALIAGAIGTGAVGPARAQGASNAESGTVQINNPEDTIVIELKDGDVYVELLPEVAPQHVARIKELARDGFYDNVVFHRVIEGFMAQTGDGQFGDTEDGYNLSRAGTGGSSLPDLPAEFSALPFDRGVVGMARSQNPNSGNSQFFIMFQEGHFLNGQYTVFGRVVAGMEHVDAIKRGDRARNGAVSDPDKMISVRVAADR